MSTIMGTREQILAYIAAQKSPKPNSKATTVSNLGYVTFFSADPAYSVTMLLGDGSPTVTGGYAGWTTVARERKRALTEWHGNEPLELEIPILFDNWALGTSLEAEIKTLERLAGLDDSMDEPPIIQFDSAGVVPYDAHDAKSKYWVISNLVMGDADRNAVGNRVRQAATVTVLEYIEDDTLASQTSAERKRRAKRAAEKKRAAARKGAGQRQYRINNGDTLRSVAARKLGKASRWKEIKKLNPKFRDPKKPLPAGQILKMPAR